MKQKVLATFLIVACFSVGILSCKKNNDNVNTYRIEGLWIGTYTVNQQPDLGSRSYSLIIKPGGTVIVEGELEHGKYGYSTGSWLLNGTELKCTITTIGLNGGQISQTLIFTYDNKGQLQDGVWSDIINPYSSLLTGKFSTLNRVN